MSGSRLEHEARDALARAMAAAAHGEDFRRRYSDSGHPGDLQYSHHREDRATARRELGAEVRRAGGGGMWLLITDERREGGPCAVCEGYDLDRGESVSVVQPYRKGMQRWTGVGPATTLGPAEPLDAGIRATVPGPVPAATGAVCPSCATQMRLGMRFCTTCGTALGAEAMPESRRGTRESTPKVSLHKETTLETAPEPARSPHGVPTAPVRPPAGPPVPTGYRPPSWPGPSVPPTPRPGPAPWPLPRQGGWGSSSGSGDVGRRERSTTSVPTSVLVGGAVVLLVAVLAVVALVALRPASTTPSAQPITVDSPETSAAAPSETGSTPTRSSVAPSTALDPASALGTIARTDSGRVEVLTESWVPQLSAKREGLVADGRTYDAAAILANHRSLTSRFGSAALLWSGDFSTYGSGDFWITVYPQPFATPEAANAWCDSAGLGSTECYAKFLSHTAPPAGSTRTRGN